MLAAERSHETESCIEKVEKQTARHVVVVNFAVSRPRSRELPAPVSASPETPA